MPKFIKNGLVMEVTDVCANLFQKQGWDPYDDESIEFVAESKLVGSFLDSKDLNDDTFKDEVISDNATIPKLSRREVMRMTKDALLSSAKDRGYTITSDKRTDIIEEFLTQQDK
jgi:hypothetical protein